MANSGIQRTIFVDIDGVIIYQNTGGASEQLKESSILPGAVEQFNKWSSECCKIVITTARKESHRKETEEILRKAGLFWDHFIMGLGSGQRILINDDKPGSDEPMAIAIRLPRNQGLEGLEV